MKLFAISFATQEIVDAYNDDPVVEDLETMAAPRVEALATESTLFAKIEQVKQVALDWLRDEDVDTTQGEWVTEPWRKGSNGRVHRSYKFMLPDPIEVARVIVQLVEEEDCASLD